MTAETADGVTAAELQASKNNPTHDLKIIGNYLYRRAADGAQNLQTGYYSTDNVNAEIRDNYIVGGTAWVYTVALGFDASGRRVPGPRVVGVPLDLSQR